MRINQNNCYDIAKLIIPYLESSKYQVKKYDDFYAIFIKNTEILTISKDAKEIRFKNTINLSTPVKDLVFKSIEWLKFMQRYE